MLSYGRSIIVIGILVQGSNDGCVVFGFDGEKLNVLLIRRGNEPFKGAWLFPGDF